jgi:hypothetical protein
MKAMGFVEGLNRSYALSEKLLLPRAFAEAKFGRPRRAFGLRQVPSKRVQAPEVRRREQRVQRA